MEKITVKCPKCSNRMEIDPKIIAFRCANCGERIDLDDESVGIQGSVNASFNINSTRSVNTIEDKADILRAKNEYKLEKMKAKRPWRYRDQQKAAPKVVYKDRYTGYGAVFVGIAKWFAILLLGVGIIDNMSKWLKYMK